MQLLVVFLTLVAAALGAQLPVLYSLPPLHQHQPGLGATLPAAPTQPSHPPSLQGHLDQHQPGLGATLPAAPTQPSHPPSLQGHLDHNGFLQTYEVEGSHVSQPPQSAEGPNDLTLTFQDPTRSQDPLLFHGPEEQDVFIQTFGEPARQRDSERLGNTADHDIPTQSFGGQTQPQGPAQIFLTPTDAHDLTQTHDGPGASYAPAQPQTHDELNVFGGRATETYEPPQPQGPTGLVFGSGGGCLQGQVLHIDGTCVVPEVTRDVYVFSIPETPRRPTSPPPSLPPPRVHEHVLFIRAPEDVAGPGPLLVPPPAQKSVVYVLKKESPDEEQRIVQAPTPAPARPEVYFITYEDGDNPSLPNGLDLQKILQTATSAPPSPLHATSPGDAAEAQREETFYSTPGGHTGDDHPLESHTNDNQDLRGHSTDISVEGHGDGGPALVGHSDAHAVLGGHDTQNLALEVLIEGDFGFGEHIDDDLSFEGHSDDGFVFGTHNDDDISLESHINEDIALAGHSNGNNVLGGQSSHSNGDFVLGGQSSHSNGDFVLGSHSNGNNVLGTHSNGNNVLGSHSNGNFVLGSQSSSGLEHGDPHSIAVSVHRDESSGDGQRGVQETLAKAPTGLGYHDGGVLGNDHTQEGGYSGYTVPARLLSASLGRGFGFNGFDDSEEDTGRRGAGESVWGNSRGRFSDNIYGPPTPPPSAPALHYDPPSPATAPALLYATP